MFSRSLYTTLLSFVLLTLVTCSPNNDAEKERENNLLLAILANPTTEGFVSSSDGTKIYYTKVGTGIPVVVLHGGPGLDHNYLVEPLKATMPGHQLIFFDQRGTGFSEGNFNQINSSFINKTKFLQDLDAIRTGLNLGDQINILGHSWGGLYAMLYATDSTYKSHVKSLALVSSAGAQHGYYGTFVSSLIGKAGGLGDLTNIQAALSSVTVPLNPSSSSYAPSLKALKNYYGFLFKYYFADFTNTPTPLTGSSANFSMLDLNSSTEKTIRNGIAIGNLINASLSIDTVEYSTTLTAGTSTLDITGSLPLITAPVKLIHGVDDVVPSSFIISNAALANNFVQPNLTGSSSVSATLISNCGHFPFIEKPTEFAAAMSGFFQ